GRQKIIGHGDDEVGHQHETRDVQERTHLLLAVLDVIELAHEQDQEIDSEVDDAGDREPVKDEQDVEAGEPGDDERQHQGEEKQAKIDDKQKNLLASDRDSEETRHLL